MLSGTPRRRLAYSFGNHMHWVDMQWLWGYHVLPGSVTDMLHFCRETGAKGNVNFDGIGYEKLASEAPEAFAALRDAIRSGTVDVVGASYGQPYGLFHGGESNVRQRIYGVRTAARLFGVRPRVFWEEEFDCFPQLPQMLKGVGFDGASLFFQWTWHTPEIPKETAPVIWWRGIDGSQLKTATRNRLNLHQWPEDVAILLDELATTPPASDTEEPLILQWLELMPSPDWMCRSEVLLPKTLELLNDPRFEVRPTTLGDYLREAPDDLPVRSYSLDEVWHGMSLGKNGDSHPRTSTRIERRILDAEVLYSLLGRFGRPYAQWDVYPTWELEEAWRNLLAAQHHDNHECESLCGRVGYVQFAAAEQLADLARAEDHLASRIGVKGPGFVATNTLGWDRRITVYHGGVQKTVSVPAWGYAYVPEADLVHKPGIWAPTQEGISFQREGFAVTVDLKEWSATFTTSASTQTIKLPTVEWTSGSENCVANTPTLDPEFDDMAPFIQFLPDEEVGMRLHVHPTFDALGITVSFEPSLLVPDPGMNAAVHTVWSCAPDEIRVDHPYAISAVKPNGTWPRKYPTGDWMTSPQWFESVKNPFTSQSLVDLVTADGYGTLIVHSGSQQWFQTDSVVRNIVTMIDPWDESGANPDAQTTYFVMPHAAMTDSERAKFAREVRDMTHILEIEARTDDEPVGDLPPGFGFVSCSPPNVLPTALYRETLDRGIGVPNYAAAQFGADYPYIVRLVEFDGMESEVTLAIRGTVASAAKTDLLGDWSDSVQIESGVEQTILRFKMRPHEIATITFDLVEGRKQVRDLDAKREIWATVHRTEC